MRLSPRTQDQLAFALLVIISIMFIIMIRATPADAAVDPFGPEANSDLLAQSTCDEACWSELVLEHFGEADHDMAMSIIDCESGFDQYADSPISTAQGGWQFLRSTWGWSTTGSGYVVDPYPDGPNDPAQSTMMARWLKDTYGWPQWECFGVLGGRARDYKVTVDLTLLLDGRPPR